MQQPTTVSRQPSSAKSHGSAAGSSGSMGLICFVHTPGKNETDSPGMRTQHRHQPRKKQERCRKEMRALRNTWLILYLNFSSVFNGLLGLYPSLLTSKPSAQWNASNKVRALRTEQLCRCCFPSPDLWEFHFWQRAWTLFTRLHISAGLISVIISFLFTTMLWQQGINSHRQEKDSNLNAWLWNREEQFSLSSNKDLTSNPTKWWFPRKPLSSSNYRLEEQPW